jgi:hypothetical protein
LVLLALLMWLPVLWLLLLLLLLLSLSHSHRMKGH